MTNLIESINEITKNEVSKETIAASLILINDDETFQMYHFHTNDEGAEAIACTLATIAEEFVEPTGPIWGATEPTCQMPGLKRIH